MTFPFPVFAPVVAAAGGGLTTLTKVAEAVSTGETITGPAGIQGGDLLVLWDRAFNLGVPAEVVPAGFNILATANDGSLTRIILSWKIATGAEANASLTGMGVGSGVDKVLIVIRGDTSISTVTPGSPAAQITGGDPTAQVVTSSGGAPPLVVVGAYSTASGTVDPRTMTPTKDGEATSGADCWLAWKIYDTSPADVTVDQDDESNINALASGFLACE